MKRTPILVTCLAILNWNLAAMEEKTDLSRLLEPNDLHFQEMDSLFQNMHTIPLNTSAQPDAFAIPPFSPTNSNLLAEPEDLNFSDDDTLPEASCRNYIYIVTRPTAINRQSAERNISHKNQILMTHFIALQGSETQIVCNICNTLWSSPDELYKHVIKHAIISTPSAHRKKSKTSCKICSAVVNYYYLKTHMARRHPEATDQK